MMADRVPILEHEDDAEGHTREIRHRRSWLAKTAVAAAAAIAGTVVVAAGASEGLRFLRTPEDSESLFLLVKKKDGQIQEPLTPLHSHSIKGAPSAGDMASWDTPKEVPAKVAATAQHTALKGAAKSTTAKPSAPSTTIAVTSTEDNVTDGKVCTKIDGVALKYDNETVPWSSCAAKWTEDCSESGCCADSNMKCFRKNAKWSACMDACDAGDDNDSWTCEELYPATPRTPEGCSDECRKADDCKLAVFSTDANGRCSMATERSSVVQWAGDNVKSIFCGDASEQEGIKNDTDTVNAQLPFQVNYDLVTCSWGGEDCSETKCCNDYLCDPNYENCWGFSCYMKDEYFSGCAATPPDGWNGTWVGGPREHRMPQGAGDTVAKHGNSLYCFTVVTWTAPRPKPFWNSEAELANTWKQYGLHVLQCDGSDIIDGVETPMAEWGSFQNIDMFMDVWRKVGDIGTWRNFDWTVKVDSDAVFLPGRLKEHLWNLNTPAGARVYVENINYKFKFMGAVEILTKEALSTFLDLSYTCIRGEHHGGEDSFLKGCLDGIGVDHLSDWSILRDRYAGINPPCNDGWAAVYHYFKKTRDWAVCYNEAMCGGYGNPTDCEFAIPVPGDIPATEMAKVE